MNLNFGILWIEDTYNEEEESSLKRCVETLGFIPKIDHIVNGEAIEELAKRNLSLHCYDLILLDYKLKDEKGDELGIKIRKLFPSTTILFYSATVTNEGELRSMIAKKEVEGVFCSHRDRFIKRAGMLVEQVAHSLNRLSGMRGLAMQVVAECDDIMKSAIKSMSERNSKCANAVSKLDTQVEESLESLKDRYQPLKEKTLEDRFKSRAVTSTVLHNHFRRLTKIVKNNPEAFELSSETNDSLKELCRKSKDYSKDVLDKRNALGHSREIETNDGLELDGCEGISVDKFPEFRKNFSLYISTFSEITKIITKLDSKKPD